MHLRFDMIGAYYAGKTQHPQQVMRDVGITYQHATPQSMGDQWWFWNCENIPNPLPTFLSELETDPMDCIGWGLDEETAKLIKAGVK